MGAFGVCGSNQLLCSDAWAAIILGIGMSSLVKPSWFRVSCPVQMVLID